jgi:hypothetical protein
MDARVTGGHFTDQIFDDLIDETMIDSEILQAKAVNFIKRANPLFVNPEDDLRVIVGTRWPGEYYNWLLDIDNNIFQKSEVLLLGCYVDDRLRSFLNETGKATILSEGEPIWPYDKEKGCGFTLETLENIRADSEYDFVHQYLNLEVSDEMRRFRKEDIKYFSWTTDRFQKPCVMVKTETDTVVTPIKNLYISMTIDPATGEGRNTDESAITVCGHDRKSGLIFVLDAWDGRVTAFDLINKVLEMAEEWKDDDRAWTTFPYSSREAWDEVQGRTYCGFSPAVCEESTGAFYKGSEEIGERTFELTGSWWEGCWEKPQPR